MIALFLFVATLVQAIPGLTGTGPATSLPAGVTQSGGALLAPIDVDGVPVLHIAVDASDPHAAALVVSRQATVESAIGTLLATVQNGKVERPVYDPRTLRVFIVPAGAADVIEAKDARHSPISILSVTGADAAAASTTIIARAQSWRASLRDALERALLDREPAVAASHLRDAVGIGVLAILVAVLLLWGVSRLNRHAQAYEAKAEARREQLRDAATSGAAEGDAHARQTAFLAISLRRLPALRGARFTRAVCALLAWIALLELFAALVWSLSLFPQTTPLASGISSTAIGVAAIWIVTGLLNRFGDLLLRRFEHLYERRHAGSSEERARELLRIPTVTSAIGGFKAFVLVFIAILASLGRIGLPVGSVVTVGGLVAIGVSLAAQNLIRDFVNGFLVLFEDQYVVGDFIVINGMSGLVETLTLRIVQIRDASGSLVTIAHSTVTTVVNRSRNWSRVDYRISVDPQADPERAIALVRESIETLAKQPAWHDVITDPVEFIGIDALSRDGTIIHAAVKTAPLRQFEVQRAINEAVHRRFAQAGIPFGAAIAG